MTVKVKIFLCAAAVAACAFGAAENGKQDVAAPCSDSISAYSMLTHDGRRMISRKKGGKNVYELVPTNQLPANLRQVRQWTIYGIKSAHSDLGLHRSNYVQRKGTVSRMDKAKELIAADVRPDSDPAAFRWVVEGWWSFLNYPADRGEAATRPFVDELRRRGRFNVGGNWCGSTTHVMGYEELCRSLYAKREMEEKWGLYTKTAQIVDNPGVSSALIGLYADAGIKYLTHWPNSYTMELGGKTLHYSYSTKGDRPCVFWWEAPDGKSRVLVWTGSTYCGSVFDVQTAFIDPLSHPKPDKAEKPPPDWKPDMARWEGRTAIMLETLEKSVPYDVWLFPNYHDDEMPSTRLADAFAAWNEKWATPVFRTVGSLDEPFERLERKWGDKIPVMRGDLSCAWDRATPAFAELLARKLAADRRLPIAEAKAAIASATAGVPFPKDNFDHAYEALQLNDDHSYGFSGYTGRRVYDTWAQHVDWIETAERAAKLGLKVASATGSLGVSEKVPKIQKLQNSKTPSSESNINPVHHVNPVKDGVTENQWYRIVVTNGVIYSILDKDLNRELLSAPANTFHYTQDRYKTWSDVSALRASRICSTVTLAPDRKAILIENVIENAADLLNNDRFKRYGHYAFPFSIDNPKFRSQLNGPVIDAFAEVLPQVANSYSCIRDWCAVEGEKYGIALVQPDTFVMEFGKQHGMNAYGHESGPASSAMWSLAFGDGLQWHLSEPPSFRFRYVITSYAGDWKSAHIPAFAAREVGALSACEDVTRHVSCDAANVELVALKAADDGNGYVARFRETEGRAVRTRIRQDLVRGAKYVLADLLERGRDHLPDGEFKIAPFAFATIRIEREGLNVAFASASEKWTGLLVRPRAFAGGIPGQMYLLWGAEEGIDAYELYRDGKMVATVHREAEDGIPFMNVRYDDLGLEPGRKYEYRIRPVFRNGHRGELGMPFYGLTRAMGK